MLTFDATATGTQGSGTSLTFAHVCTGSNLILWVAVGTISHGDDVTGVTYNGVSMTQANKVASGSGELYLYYLVNPGTGSLNVIVSTNQTEQFGAVSMSYTGALQTGVPDSTATNSVTATSIALATTVVKSNCWLVSIYQGSNTAILASGTDRGSTYNVTHVGDSNGVVGTGSQNQTWNNTTSAGLVGCVASFAPAPQGGFFALI